MFFWGGGTLLGPAMMAHLHKQCMCVYAGMCLCVFVYVWVNSWFEEQG